MDPNAHLAVNFLPWLEVREEVTLGQFNFWPFKKSARERIGDKGIRDHLEKVFATYVQPQPFPKQNELTMPVSELTIVTGDTCDLTVSLDSLLLSQATDALTFACIDASNDWNWCTSDNFELVRLRFSPG